MDAGDCEALKPECRHLFRFSLPLFCRESHPIAVRSPGISKQPAVLTAEL
jgi:hypothetical protein